ncbi:GNAT family N-acetyltransferase [Uliginosibacterium sp. TH139]|uniref:GNAT family N-acetyltransferase n=1 Tax=Uliginosibacterium sp. TH139 TaxID=2067453 RepID=UPI000C7BBFC2|nr:GNAT family N-acetyltransferase [Uliginosibacterium sp. TH139]PLK49568.1 GNAT family N-acetyltransferase [Uliginosibacterium sp. TH139]
MISYRQASIADIPSICALGNEVNEIHHRVWPQIFAPAGEAARDQAFWAKGIGAPEAETFVAERDDQVIGFVSVSMFQESGSLMQPMRYGRIGSVSVASEHRGKGVGRALMARAEEWAAKHGAIDMRLHAWAFNERAIALYEEQGYAIRSHFLGKPL